MCASSLTLSVYCCLCFAPPGARHGLPRLAVEPREGHQVEVAAARLCRGVAGRLVALSRNATLRCRNRPEGGRPRLFQGLRGARGESRARLRHHVCRVRGGAQGPRLSASTKPGSLLTPVLAPVAAGAQKENRF